MRCGAHFLLFHIFEDGVVGGFNKMSDRFVDQFLTRDGESVEDAKRRLAAEQAEREKKD